MVQVLSTLVTNKIESMGLDDDMKDVVKKLLICELEHGDSSTEGKKNEVLSIIIKGMPDDN